MTPIRDYALIGNCETAALVNPGGGIDWLCLPAFDAAPVFNRLLDDEKGGDFTIRPSETFEVARRYLDDSAIFETKFSTAQGVVRLTDFFVVARTAGEGRKASENVRRDRPAQGHGATRGVRQWRLL